MLLLFDRQDEHGALPDCVTDATQIWNFTKPPVHGWALRWMLSRPHSIGPRRLAEIYGPLCRWTQWWLTQRGGDNSMPRYNHGNDSGWDNSTVFDGGAPVQSPDLAALLIVQMRTLADLASRLGDEPAAQQWQQRAGQLLDTLLARHWRNNRFVALRGSDDTPCESASLLLYVPLILGTALPESIRRALLAGLRADRHFITAHGLASESIASPLYRSDGYWRGPVWAPSTLLLVEAIAAAGEHALAREIARRFCDTVKHAGCAENFDAITGAGYRDPAHTWTASIFLILAHAYLD